MEGLSLSVTLTLKQINIQIVPHSVMSQELKLKFILFVTMYCYKVNQHMFDKELPLLQPLTTK